MSIIICLVCLDIVAGSMMASLNKCVLFIFFDSVSVGVGMICGFMSFLGCKFSVLSREVVGGLYFC